MSAPELTAIIANETTNSKGVATFDPGIWGGTDGKYFGLFQAGPSERAQFDVDTKNPNFDAQLGALVDYATARGFIPGVMDAADLYTTILGGNPFASQKAKSGDLTIAQWTAQTLSAANLSKMESALGEYGMMAGLSSPAMPSSIAAMMANMPSQIGTQTAAATPPGGWITPTTQMGGVSRAPSTLDAASLGFTRAPGGMAPSVTSQAGQGFYGPSLQAALDARVAPTGVAATGNTIPSPVLAAPSSLSGPVAQWPSSYGVYAPGSPFASVTDAGTAFSNASGTTPAPMSPQPTSAERNAILGQAPAASSKPTVQNVFDQSTAVQPTTAPPINQSIVGVNDQSQFQHPVPTEAGMAAAAPVAAAIKAGDAAAVSFAVTQAITDISRSMTPQKAAESVITALISDPAVQTALATAPNIASAVVSALPAKMQPQAQAVFSQLTGVTQAVQAIGTGLQQALAPASTAPVQSSMGMPPGTIVAPGTPGTANAVQPTQTAPIPSSQSRSLPPGVGGLAMQSAPPFSPAAARADVQARAGELRSGLSSAAPAGFVPYGGPAGTGLTSTASGPSTIPQGAPAAPKAFTAPSFTVPQSMQYGVGSQPAPKAVSFVAPQTPTVASAAAAPSTKSVSMPNPAYAAALANAQSIADASAGRYAQNMGLDASLPAANLPPKTIEKLVKIATPIVQKAITATTKPGGLAAAPMSAAPGAAGGNLASNGWGSFSSATPAVAGGAGYGSSGTTPSSRGYSVNNGITTYSTNNGTGTISFNQATGAITGGTGTSAGAGGTVLCTHYYRKGWLPKRVWLADLRYGRSCSPATRRGYLLWAAPMVASMERGNRLLEYLMWPVVREWAHGTAIGLVIGAVLEPFCRFLGSQMPIEVTS